jgi:hypothetical protein
MQKDYTTKQQIDKYKRFQIGKRSQSVSQPISSYRPKQVPPPLPKIIQSTNSDQSDADDRDLLPSFTNLKFWTIIGTELKKSFLSSNWLKKVEQFALSCDDEYRFMFDEILEMQFDLQFKF